MSTNDVPGFNPINNDELCMGVWADHEDGSLMLVQSSEGGRIIYTLFDLSADPPLQYNDTMAEKSFKRTYSWPDSDDKWTWHDKSPFPWDQVIDAGVQQGPGYASAEALETAAARVAKSRDLKSKGFDKDDAEEMAAAWVEIVKSAGPIIRQIQRALGNLRP